MLLKKNIFIFITLVYAQASFSQAIELSIIGDNDLETEIINGIGYKNLHESLKLAKTEVDKFQKKAEKEGYLNNKLRALNKLSDSVFVAKIYLKNKIESISIYIDINLAKKEILKSLQLSTKNNSLNVEFKNLENTIEALNKKLISNGYPFLRIRLKNIIQKNDSTLIADLSIEKATKKRGLDKIVIKGYEKFPKAYLKRFLKIKTSNTFNLESVKKQIKALNNINFARQLKDPEILFTKDSTQLYLYLEKTTSNTFDGFLGFATDESTNKIQFNGYLNLVLNNNLNFGESLYFNYKSDESQQKNFDLSLKLPYLFNSPLGIEGSLNIINRDSTFSNTKQKIKLFYQLDSNSSFNLGTESTISSNLRESDININVLDYNSNFNTIGYQYLKRQNNEPLFQIKSLLNAEFGIGSRKTSIINENQSLLNITGQHIFNLNNKNSLFIKGQINILNSDSYLENELIRFGGINSIRGFAENSITATNLYILNTEYRYKLSPSLFVNTIVDFGTFKNNLLNQDEKLYGFGLGFGVLTKGGLLRFIYANGKNQNLPFSFSNSKIHLSLTTVF